jgi:two-component system, cell cycle response regulator
LSDDQRLAEALDSGADDLIAKPVKRLELHARLRMAGRLKNTQLYLVHLAETDSLTGLLNRRAFFERLHALLQSARKNSPLSAVLIDIDHFKRINDTHGHDVGDIVIKRVAAEVARHGGLVCRLGGEEFAMILQDHDESEAFRVANSLRRVCERLPFSVEGQAFAITCSLGISGLIEGDTPDKLLKRADVALYQAKLAGRNRVHVAEPSISTVGLPDGVTRKQRR